MTSCPDVPLSRFPYAGAPLICCEGEKYAYQDKKIETFWPDAQQGPI